MGSVLVVRSDGEDVTLQQVEAWSRFYGFKVFENAHGGGRVEMMEEEVVGL